MYDAENPAVGNLTAKVDCADVPGAARHYNARSGGHLLPPDPSHRCGTELPHRLRHLNFQVLLYRIALERVVFLSMHSRVMNTHADESAIDPIHWLKLALVSVPTSVSQRKVRR